MTNGPSWQADTQRACWQAGSRGEARGAYDAPVAVHAVRTLISHGRAVREVVVDTSRCWNTIGPLQLWRLLCNDVFGYFRRPGGQGRRYECRGLYTTQVSSRARAQDVLVAKSGKKTGPARRSEIPD